MEQNNKPIQLKLDFNYIHTCNLKVEDISGILHSVCNIASVTYFPGQTEYTVTFLDNSAAGILPAELLRAAVVFPGDPGTPQYNPHREETLVFAEDEQPEHHTKPDNTPKTDPWDQVQEKSWDEFCGYGLLCFVNAFLHIFGWAIVLHKVDNVVTKVYPARVPFRGFAEKEMTKGYRQIAKFMEENASEIRKEAELD